jgi:hypothetical protein
MKKSVDFKLKLTRETLRALEQPQLEVIAGGLPRTYDACATTQGSACYSRCTCTTALC